MSGKLTFRFLSIFLILHFANCLPSLPRYTSQNDVRQTSENDVINSEIKKVENELLYEILMNNLIDQLEDSMPSNVLQDSALDTEEGQEKKEMDSILDEMSIEELLSELEKEGIPFGTNQNLTKSEKVELATWGEDSSIIPNPVLNNNNIPPEFIDNVCSIDRPCADDQYCYETSYASECLPCLAEGTLCVDDAQCCFNEFSPTKCIRGSCESGALPGSEGTICESQSQCLDGLCCAMVKGYPRRVCKPFTTQGEQCTPLFYFQPLGVRVLTEKDHYCPCETGLVCSEIEQHVYEGMVKSSSPYMVCKASQQENIEPISEQRFNEESNNIAKLLEALKREQNPEAAWWQQRDELENDQRFLNQGPPIVHKTSKKSIKENDRMVM